MVTARRAGAVEFVDVPEFGFAVVAGTGAPGGAEFTQALQAEYSVSYGAHFLVKKQRGQAPKVMPLEAPWWVDDPDQQDILAAARGALDDQAARMCGAGPLGLVIAMASLLGFHEGMLPVPFGESRRTFVPGLSAGPGFGWV